MKKKNKTSNIFLKSKLLIFFFHRKPADYISSGDYSFSGCPATVFSSMHLSNKKWQLATLPCHGRKTNKKTTPPFSSALSVKWDLAALMLRSISTRAGQTALGSVLRCNRVSGIAKIKP